MVINVIVQFFGIEILLNLLIQICISLVITLWTCIIMHLSYYKSVDGFCLHVHFPCSRFIVSISVLLILHYSWKIMCKYMYCFSILHYSWKIILHYSFTFMQNIMCLQLIKVYWFFNLNIFFKSLSSVFLGDLTVAIQFSCLFLKRRCAFVSLVKVISSCLPPKIQQLIHVISI